jgi:hypothetical protein
MDSTLIDDTIAQDTRQAPAHSRTHTTAGSRSKRAPGHHVTHSRVRSEARTPGEYALHHLLNSFFAKADLKINQCIANIEDAVAPVEQLCGPGVDVSFDQLISALGHIARQEPKALVDSLMLWRKAKGDASSAAKKQLQQQRLMGNISALPATLPRRNTEPTQQDGAVNNLQLGQEDSSFSSVDSSLEEYTMADRRATVSVYLLCRVLIEVFQQSSLAAITPDLAGKLEDIVFQQLKDVDPAQILTSSLRLANWRIYGQVLGQMSGLDFLKVTSRFVHELDLYQAEIARNRVSAVAREAENRAELLILGMRHLRLTGASTSWTESCDFLKAVGNLFVNSHGLRIKQAYCQVFERLLLVLAAEEKLDQTPQKLRDFIDMMNTRLAQLLTKVRHWPHAFPVLTLLLCVSPPEVFSTQWLSTINNLGAKLKDRTTRSLALQAICRLTWVYIYRAEDSPQIKLRNIQDVIKVALPAGRKTHLSTEPSIAEPLIQLIRIIGFRYKDLWFRSIILPLTNSDLFLTKSDLRIEQMEPEKMVIGIRAFLAVMADVELGEKGQPAFPSTFPNAVVHTDLMPTSPIFAKPKLLTEPKVTTERRTSSSSRPVNVSVLDEVSQNYYRQFCEILGKITILCDNTFGGQAVLNEKFSGPGPKTPLVDAFSFSRKEDGTIADQRHLFYDLLHVAIEALPRCFSDRIPLTPLINLLCTGSAHILSTIANSSAESLRSIARQGHAQTVAIAFPRFIFTYDSKYSTMSDDGMLGQGHIENTLSLYVELLQIWTEELKQKTRGNPIGVSLEMTNVYSHVDEIEAYGLFFLCSQARRARTFAIKVLQLVTDFDKALGKDEPSRIIRILENESSTILQISDDLLTVAERSRIQKGKQKSAMQNTLIEICSGEAFYDATLWSKVFPNLIRIIFERCPNAIALSRGRVTERLALMHSSIEDLGSTPRTPIVNSYNYQVTGRSAGTPPEVLINQWKLYLTMACVTLSSAGGQSQSQLANNVHNRKASRPGGVAPEKMSSARSLFSAVIPQLSAGPDNIRNAVVFALGSINRKLYRTLLESLQYAVTTCNDEAKARIGAHQRSASSPQRSHRTELLRTEVTHVYKMTASFLRDAEVRADEWILNNIVTYTRDLRIFLNDAEVQDDMEYNRLRIHYCGLIEELYEGVNRTKVPTQWISFESRKSAFTLMEEWCGFGPEHGHSVSRDNRQAVFMQQAEVADRMNTNAAIEKDKTLLRYAALSAMAALCAGPISMRTETKTMLMFQLPRMLSWVDMMFVQTNDKIHAFGRRALKRLIVHNMDYPIIMEHAVERCYRTEKSKALESYFEVVAEVLTEYKDYPLPFWRILGAVIFTLGNENRDVRMKSARLLRTLDERQPRSSKLQDFDISISDKTTAVYKLAQFEYSKRLSKAYPELAFIIFSEFCLHFKNVSTDHQRNMVAAILPWIQTIELQLDPNGGVTANSYMLLSNLFEITIRLSGSLHNEVQALWQALATGPHGGNVQLILDFIIFLSLERREQSFVEYAKQIVVYLSSTPAGSRVMEYFLLQLVPKNMVTEKKAEEHQAPDMAHLPYAADLSAILPMGNKQQGLSLGQIALIFLVDLMVAPVSLSTDHAIKLVHVVLILWDHYILSVQEQAREMLVHLVHELVTAKISDEVLTPQKSKIERLVEAMRRDEQRVVWSYEDNGKEDDDQSSRVPAAMAYLSKELVELFGLAYENFTDVWAKEALQWASQCPVRHLACRSFQVFRCISVTIDARMLADMLARLSNTIADEQTDYQTFSLEILTTLKIIIGALDLQDLLRYPQLFWTTCACLDTIHEREFYEALGMLERLLDRLDLTDPMIVKSLLNGKPSNWEGGFSGIQRLVYKGLRSADSLDRTLTVLHRLAALPNNELVGDDDRLLYSVLANLPRFLRQFDLEVPDSRTNACAEQLSAIARVRKLSSLSHSLTRLIRNDYDCGQAFLASIVGAIRSTFFPQHDSQSLIFMIGLLTNSINWFRVKTLEVLCILIPEVNMKSPQISVHGPDLISPLLRLLQTDLCPQALEVMDHIMEVSGHPMEKHHMRMSMASGSARAVRKEYESTKSLYGIPLPSGWSMPMPAVSSSRTRNNVHAVFHTCGDSETLQENAASTPEFEFHADDGYSDSYFPDDRNNTMKSADTVADKTMGDLVHNLDDLDDFFNDADEKDGDVDTQRTPIPSYISVHEDGAHVYDQQTAPILRKSLARTPSSASFQNGLAESRPPTSHHIYPQAQPVMNPGAFNAPLSAQLDDGPGPSLPTSSKKTTLTPATAAAPIRPGLHSRSITSPANQFPLSQPTAVPYIPQHTYADVGLIEEDRGPYDEDAFMSDSENTPFPSLITTTSNTLRAYPVPDSASQSQGMSYRPSPTSATESSGPFSGVRRGMRRLTGGKSESQKEKERVREMARMRAFSGGQGTGAPANSPRVPRVPLEYLNNTTNTSSPTSPGYSPPQ